MARYDPERPNDNFLPYTEDGRARMLALRSDSDANSEQWCLHRNKIHELRAAHGYRLFDCSIALSNSGGDMDVARKELAEFYGERLMGN